MLLGRHEGTIYRVLVDYEMTEETGVIHHTLVSVGTGEVVHRAVHWEETELIGEA
tara:strand:- start:1525 stop:1689 length:165 start_codon:yes stop_codon:yes gene_type:complete